MKENRKNISKKQRGLTSYRKGHLAEVGALLWLWAKGYSLLARRYHTDRGEIDLIMRHHHTIIFIEIKYRTSQSEALSAITPRQKWRILKASHSWLARHPWASNYSYRYDALCFGRPFRKNWITHIPSMAMPE